MDVFRMLKMKYPAVQDHDYSTALKQETKVESIEKEFPEPWLPYNDHYDKTT